jgi:cytochrome bd-type quinol oxidase subunit 2
MSRYTVPSMVTALVVLGLAVGSVLLGQNLLPTRVDATAKGTLAPWFIVWGMIGIVALCAVVLAGFLVMTAVKGFSDDDSHAQT